MSKKKIEVDLIQSLIEKNPCDFCKKAGYPTCKGHGKSGGGGNDSSDEKTLEYQPTDTLEFLELFSALLNEQVKPIFAPSNLEKPSLSLSLSNENDKGTLILRPKPGKSLEDEEAAEFLKRIERLFMLFKEALKKMGVDTKSFTWTPTKDGIFIRIPSPKYYDLFIDQLTSFLLGDEPPTSLDFQRNSTPFQMQPKPKAEKDVKEEEQHFNPRPRLNPLDVNQGG